MLRRITSCLVLSLVLSPAFAAEEFLEVEGALVVDGERAYVQIDRIYRFHGRELVEQVGTVEVTCPAELPATTRIGPGDRLPLLVAAQDPRRSFLHRGRGGEIRLAVPPDGWSVDCGNGAHRLHGLIVDRHELTRELVVRGRRGGFFSRLSVVPGRAAELPDRLTLRLAWEPIPPGPLARERTAVASSAPALERRSR